MLEPSRSKQNTAPRTLRDRSPRRAFLGSAAAAAGVVAATSQKSFGQPGAAAPALPWLEEVQRPPAAGVPPGALPPLVPEPGAAAVIPATAAEWAPLRDRIERAWLELLGPLPAPPPLALEILGEDVIDGCRRRRVRYACEAGITTEAFVLLPPADATADTRKRTESNQPGNQNEKRSQSTSPGANQKRPGIVAFHSTTDSTNECLAGLREGPDRMLGVALARRGYVTICPRCFLWDDRTGYAEQVRRFQQRHPGALGMRKMLSDGSRALDVLAATEGVDPDRLGCVGHSLGAKEALYLAAFDRRVRAAVAHDGGLGRRQSNWDAVWYLGPGVPPMFDHHQLLALAAPRAVLVQGGGPGASDGAASWPFVAAALPIHKLYGDSPRLGLDIHGGGHNLTDRAIERLVAWLDIWLAAPA